AAAAPGGLANVRGTSYAAPLVAGRLALRLARPDRKAAEAAVADLAAGAVDLGARGADKLYGRGLVAEDLRAAPPKVAGAR
ncbi:hypothetical protein G3573_19175, partial [Caulobacter sp. 17J65-9]|nr:hypothetical protein [Caulobacter sp. 17J65-9]